MCNLQKKAATSDLRANSPAAIAFIMCSAIPLPASAPARNCIQLSLASLRGVPNVSRIQVAIELELINSTLLTVAAKKLGEQCFYAQTCSYSDPNSQCVQVHNNAKCDCVEGFHSVIHYKPTKKEFCTPGECLSKFLNLYPLFNYTKTVLSDMANLGSDLPTLLGVTSGIAVLAGLICMVLHLFSKNKYPRHRGHFADTHLPPPILYSSDTGTRLSVAIQPQLFVSFSLSLFLPNLSTP